MHHPHNWRWIEILSCQQSGSLVNWLTLESFSNKDVARAFFQGRRIWKCMLWISHWENECSRRRWDSSVILQFQNFKLSPRSTPPRRVLDYSKQFIREKVNELRWNTCHDHTLIKYSPALLYVNIRRYRLKYCLENYKNLKTKLEILLQLILMEFDLQMSRPFLKVVKSHTRTFKYFCCLYNWQCAWLVC